MPQLDNEWLDAFAHLMGQPGMLPGSGTRTDPGTGFKLFDPNIGVGGVAFKPKGTSIGSTPKQGRVQGPKGILAELNNRVELAEPNTARFGAVQTRIKPKEEPGFFMGPFANEQNVPGVTLARSGPQKARQVSHGTVSETPFDIPVDQGGEEFGIHVSSDPAVTNIYSDPIYTKLGEDSVPRNYPMIQATGGMLSAEHGLVDAGPWGDPFMAHGKLADSITDQEAYDNMIDQHLREKYPGEKDPWLRATEEGYTGMYDSAQKEVDQTVQSYVDSMSPEYQRIFNGLKAGNNPAQVFGEWPAADFQHYGTGTGSLVIDPGTLLPAFSPEGMLARRWNEVAPMNPLDDIYGLEYADRAMSNLEQERERKLKREVR